MCKIRNFQLSPKLVLLQTKKKKKYTVTCVRMTQIKESSAQRPPDASQITRTCPVTWPWWIVGRSNATRWNTDGLHLWRKTSLPTEFTRRTRSTVTSDRWVLRCTALRWNVALCLRLSCATLSLVYSVLSVVHNVCGCPPRCPGLSLVVSHLHG